jgi:hypothetical protein
MKINIKNLKIKKYIGAFSAEVQGNINIKSSGWAGISDKKVRTEILDSISENSDSGTISIDGINYYIANGRWVNEDKSEEGEKSPGCFSMFFGIIVIIIIIIALIFFF